MSCKVFQNNMYCMSCKVFQNNMHCMTYFNTVNDYAHTCAYMLRNRSKKIYTKMLVTSAQQAE